MANLASAVSARQRYWELSAPLAGGTRYVLADNELVAVLNGPLRPTQVSSLYDPPRYRVQRGVGGTARASHVQGTTLTPKFVEFGSTPIDTGGGGLPTYASRASYSGSPVNVANDNVAETPLTWDSLGSGVELLDRTDPERPTVIEAGIYAISASVQCAEFLTDGGMFRVTLHLDLLGDDSVSEMNGGAQWTGGGGHSLEALLSVQNTYYIPADGAVEVRVFNRDGAATRGFFLREALVQRLS